MAKTPDTEETTVEPTAKPSSDGFFLPTPDPASDTDLITEAIRENIISQQNDEIRKWLLGKATAEQEKELEEKGLRAFLAAAENKKLLEQAYEDKDLTGKLTEIEVREYGKVHEKFKDNFQTIKWEDGPAESSTRTKEVKNKNGDPLCTLTEKTETIPGGIPVSKYRTVDFPRELKGKGPMHVSMAAQDKNGNNIDEDKAVYFTAHYDKAGKLTEISYPQPMKFTDKGIGYFEMNGQAYSLPITKSKFEEMVNEIQQNQNASLSMAPRQPITTPSPSLIQPPETILEPQALKVPHVPNNALREEAHTITEAEPPLKIEIPSAKSPNSEVRDSFMEAASAFSKSIEGLNAALRSEQTKEPAQLEPSVKKQGITMPEKLDDVMLKADPQLVEVKHEPQNLLQLKVEEGLNVKKQQGAQASVNQQAVNNPEAQTKAETPANKYRPPEIKKEIDSIKEMKLVQNMKANSPVGRAEELGSLKAPVTPPPQGSKAVNKNNSKGGIT